MAETVTFSYRAFLSYSHRDRAWGQWLHRRLEAYRVDKDLVGRTTEIGPVPKSLRPIFRDRDEFSAGHSLNEQTLAALRGSEFLIVMCSPDAAKSRYVNEEVRLFKAMGRARRILPVIVAGKPGSADEECFPPAVRFEVESDGQVSDRKVEPIAADATPVGDKARCGISGWRSTTHLISRRKSRSELRGQSCRPLPSHSYGNSCHKRS